MFDRWQRFIEELQNKGIIEKQPRSKNYGKKEKDESGKIRSNPKR